MIKYTLVQPIENQNHNQIIITSSHIVVHLTTSHADGTLTSSKQSNVKRLSPGYARVHRQTPKATKIKILWFKHPNIR